MRRLAASAALVLAATALGTPPASADATTAALEEVTEFGSNPGALRMFRHTPEGLAEGRPVVLALHGCTQNAAGYATSSGWVELADRWGFTLVVPQQESSNNSNHCFNWFEQADTTRDSGEAASLAQMRQRALDDSAGDPRRVYVSGLSAGGAMTAALLATYPEHYAGGGIVAGLPYRCAAALPDAFTCMNPGKDQSPQQWGDLVRAASEHTGPRPTVSLWHGDADTTVAPANMRESVEQWTDVHGTDQAPDAEDTVGGYPRARYDDGSGRTVVETVTVTGMEHGQPVDPGTGEQQCGSPAEHMPDVDICAAWRLGSTWGLAE